MSNPAIAFLDMELAELDAHVEELRRFAEQERLERWFKDGRAVYQQELEKESYGN